MGRPTKLTPEVMLKICARLEAAVPKVTAAQSAGISKRTLYDWLKRAGDPVHDPDGIYADFAAQVQAAEAKGRLGLHNLALKQAQGTKCKACGGTRGSDRMTMFLLERLYPATYGAKLDIRVRAEMEAQVETAMGRLEAEFTDEPETYSRVLRALTGADLDGVIEGELVE